MKYLKTPSSKQIKNALGWSFAENAVNRGLSMLVRLYLVTLLAPEAFGLVAMAIVFIAFLQVMGEMGMTAALIQRKAENLTETHWRTGFTVSFSISALGWIVILFVLAPFAAFFYGEGELRLILPVLGIGLVTDSLAVVQRAKLTKALRFKALCLASAIATLISSALGIYMAYHGYGVWALVAKTLSNSILLSSFLSISAGWIPRFGFAKAAFKDLFSFGAYVFAEQMLTFLMGNIDYLMIGKLVGRAGLGAYTLAFTLTDIFRHQIMGVFNRVFFPVYANVQDDKKKAADYFLKVVKYSSLIIVPVMAIMILDAEGIIFYAFGKSWRESIFPLQVLALSCIIHSIGGTSSTFIRAAGHARLAMALNFASVVFLAVPAIIFGSIIAGLNGAACGVLAHRVGGRLLTLIFVFRLFPIRWAGILRVLRPTAGICLVIVVVNRALVFFLPESLTTFLIRIIIEMLTLAVFLPIFLPELKAAVARTDSNVLSNRNGGDTLCVKSDQTE